MHYSKCAEAWKRDEEANKPEADRRPLPAGPQLRDGSQPSESTKPEDLEEFNRLALKIWKSQALETCPNCQRSFHSKALKAHMKGCHAEPFLGPSFISTSKQSEASRTRRYPTVKQSIERHTKAPAVSKPGPIKLVQERVDAFRGVPPNRRSSEDSPTNSCTVSRLASCSTLRSSPSPERRKSLLQRSSSCTPKTLTPSPSSPEGTPYHRQSSSAASSVPPCQKHFRGRQNIAVSYDHLGWRRERRTNHAQNHNDGDSPPRRQRRSRPDVEARLEALEAGHVRENILFPGIISCLQVAMSDTLRRIETILSSAFALQNFIVLPSCMTKKQACRVHRCVSLRLTVDLLTRPLRKFDSLHLLNIRRH